MDREIKKDFDFLRKDILGVMVYGSLATGQSSKRSDIDVCIVIGRPSTPRQMRLILSKVWRNVNTNKKGYDVKVFEELPLRVKMGVIMDGKVIIGKKQDIHEYFTRFRRMWNDQKHRQEL